MSTRLTVRQQHEADVYNERAVQWLERITDDDLAVDAARPPYPNREHVEFLDFVFARLGPIRGTRILEVGCGSGTLSTYLALNGAEAVGVDVSDGMLEVARKRAAANGVTERTEFVSSAVEELDHSDASYDAVIANQVLHHLDLRRAMPNIARLVGDRGQALFVEPVLLLPEWTRSARYSKPVARFFPSRADTPDERSLDFATLELVRNSFARCEQHPFQLTTRLQNFVELNDSTFARLERLDHRLLVLPGARRLARYVVLVATGTPT